MKLPNARTAEIIEQDLGKELLIYDLQTNKAYTLNETLMKVYRACNGTQTFDELKRQYKFTDDLIHLALDELQENDLVAGYESNHFSDLSRRQVIRRVGLASVIALPVIAGIVAPAAAQAGSCSNTQTDPTNCGTCGNVCPPVRFGTPGCSGGQCTPNCSFGSTTCNGSCVDTLSDPNNCGGCLKSCATPGAVTYCVNGTCMEACAVGFTNCPNGCKDTQNDFNNCGACGNVCYYGTACRNGVCG